MKSMEDLVLYFHSSHNSMNIRGLVAIKQVFGSWVVGSEDKSSMQLFVVQDYSRS